MVPALQNRIGNLAWIVRQAEAKVGLFYVHKKDKLAGNMWLRIVIE